MWGWYSRFEDAERAVLENHTDIFEHNYYDFACIEEMPEGVCSSASQAWWYKATYPEGFDSTPGGMYPHVTRTAPPDWTEGMFNFCMS